MSCTTAPLVPLDLPDPVAAVRQELDAEIKRLSDSLHAVQSRRNALAPIARLHNEIFSMIFIFHVQSVKRVFLQGHQPTTTAFSQVCQLWRAIALGCGELWSTISGMSPEWTQEKLRRSKRTPLTIAIELLLPATDPRIPRWMELIYPEISRIKCFKLHHASPTILRRMLSMLDAPAPLIEELSIHSMMPVLCPHIAPPMLPHDLFDKVHPRLCRVELTECSMRWTSSVLCASLKELRLHQVSDGNRPTLALFLSALARAPSLEILELSGVIPLADSDSDSESLSLLSIVPLPRLRALSLKSKALEVAPVLQFLSFPSDVNLSISTFGSHSDYRVLLPILKEKTSGERPGIARLELSKPASNAVEIRCFSSGVYMETTGDPPELFLSFYLEEEGLPDDDSLLTKACSYLRLEDTQRLVLRQFNETTERQWRRLFRAAGNFPSIEILRLETTLVEQIFRALSIKPTQKEDAVALPGLDRLELFNVMTITPTRLHRLLDKPLTTREERGMDIVEIHIEKCVTAADIDVHRLEARGVEVTMVHYDWDEMAFGTEADIFRELGIFEGDTDSSESSE
ncbi:hypothetical protein PLICRDRAFT_274819 [Plicaturopsis crispa FD-325 SS-3]|nr:hypothetical protein PLICRDRAFT_274819 [Plicaturopsis crispa FD-325 SS-3]